MEYFTLPCLLTLAALLALTTAEIKCKFPREWKGRWHQGGLGEIRISEKTISQKGACAEHHRDYYLVRNRERDCYKCLLIIKRHRNVLQYKESYCVPRDTLRNVCRQIKVEASLFTLVREPHIPVRCPFNDAYYFNYNDLTAGFCESPISYAKPCAGESRYRFHFQHCVKHTIMNEQDLDYECVATWKDGSDMYMYGKFAGVSIDSKDESYKCFKYESYGSELYMSMSADATCRGLRSSRDGPLIMEFTKDQRGWPQPTCQFPEWFSEVEWRDMSGKHLIQANQRMRGAIEINFRRRPDSRETTKSELRCVDVLQHNETSGNFMAVSYSSVGCNTKYQCVVLRQKAHDLVELSLGKLVEYDEAKMCVTKGEFPEDYLLIRNPTTPMACPFPGRYHVMSGTANCHEDILSGCHNTSRFDVTCEEDAGGLIQTECLSTWKEDNTSLILVRKLNDESKHDRISCISLTERKNSIEFSTDARCHKGIKDLTSKPIELSLSTIKAPCEDPLIQQEVGSTISESTNGNVKKEGTYQHVGREGRDEKKNTKNENIKKNKQRPQKSQEVSYSTAQNNGGAGASSGSHRLSQQGLVYVSLIITLITLIRR